MTIGLLIKQDGERIAIDYTRIDILHRFTRFTENRGIGRMSVFDEYQVDEIKYTFYGWTNGGCNFNEVDFPSHNVFGDVIIISSINTQLVDIEGDVIDMYFFTEDLDDTLLEDELESLDTYDLDDSFIASDDDFLDYIDY